MDLIDNSYAMHNSYTIPNCRVIKGLIIRNSHKTHRQDLSLIYKLLILSISKFMVSSFDSNFASNKHLSYSYRLSHMLTLSTNMPFSAKSSSTVTLHRWIYSPRPSSLVLASYSSKTDLFITIISACMRSYSRSICYILAS